MSLVGRLEDLALSDIFQILSIGKKTGTLVLKGSRGNALITFQNGLITRAETDDLEDGICEDLLNAGIIKDTVYHLAFEVKKKLPLKSYSEILFELGSVGRDILDKATRKRIEKVVCSLLFWQDGDFQFELDDINPNGKTALSDAGWELAKGMSPEYLLMEGARVQDESTQTSFSSAPESSSVELDDEAAWDGDWGAQADERKDIVSLRALTQELRFPNSASEITLLILRCASEIFQRGILFMVGDEEIVGLGQFGLEIENPDERIREIAFSYVGSGFINRIISEKRPYKGELEEDGAVMGSMLREIGESTPDEVALFTLIAESRVVALLYCDNLTTGEKFGPTEGLEIFIDQAGLALEKSLLQRRLQEMEDRAK